MVKTPLPELYARWIAAILPGPPPVENEAMCTDCAMCPRTGETISSDWIFFDHGSKCCTYTPSLPNFLAGAILADPTLTAGRASLEVRIAKGLGAGPVAILPPPTYNLLYRHSLDTFGRNQALRCPHYENGSGTCSIWPYREPTCATWFCKHDRGSIGQAFWRALQTFLNSVSRDLSLWCVLQLDIGTEALTAVAAWREGRINGETLQPGEVDGQWDAGNARRTWGRWWGRESTFYIECIRLVDELEWPRVAGICGPEVQADTLLLRHAWDMLQETHLPTHLSLGRFEVTGATSAAVRVQSYSRLDPLDLPPPVFKALSYFDGRPIAEVLAATARDLGARLDHRLLRTLLDFGILHKGQKPPHA